MMVDDPPSTPREVQGAMVAWIAHLKKNHSFEIDDIKGNSWKPLSYHKKKPFEPSEIVETTHSWDL